ncbi:MAG: MraY family glycosyltransferase [Clostridia bacterium]|nr:MraY family glycosyltransferase [Clostridia bacterium]
MIRYLGAILFSTACALLLTPQVRAYAIRRDIVDRPRERRVHTAPVALLGGVGMYIAFSAAAMLFTKLDRNTVGLIIGGGVIVAVGVADDILELRPLPKLLGQIAAALVLTMFGVKIEFVTSPFGGMYYLGVLSIPVTVFWVVAFSNVVNFLDGLDGLAAGVSAIGALAMAFAAFGKGQERLVVLCLSLAGSALGFLYFNFNPAKIFMGDAGAMFLGFTVAGISAMGALKRPATLALLVPVLVMGVPILDTAFAIFRRVKEHVSVATGDRDHVHHRLLAMGMTQRQAVLTLYMVSGFLAAAACGVVVVDPRIGVGGALTALGAVVLVGERSGVLKVDSRHKLTR